MAVYRHIWQFLNGDGSTWQEIWYHQGSNLATELTSIPATLVDARIQLLMSQHNLMRIRIADTGGNRSTGVVPYVLHGGIDNTVFRTAPPGASMVIQCSGSTGGQKHWWMRGGAGTDYQNDSAGNPSVSPGWRTKFNTLIQQIVAYQYGLRVRQTRTQQPYSNVPSIASASGGQAVLTLQNQRADILAGSQIICGTFNKKDLPALNGIFTVRAVGTVAGPPVVTTLTIDYALPNGQSAVAINRGRIRPYVATSVSTMGLTSLQLVYMGTRITKGPRANSRGARRAQRIRQLL